MINAIIMASGFGKRMGFNKLFLEYKGKAFVENIMEVVNSCDFNSRLVVANNIRILNMASKNGLTPLFNSKAYLGQSESIKLGVLKAPEAEGYMFFTADQPFLDKETISFLIDKFNQNPQSIIVPTSFNKRGSPVIFPRKFKSELLNLSGDVGGKSIIKKNQRDVLLVEVKNPLALFDVDHYPHYVRVSQLSGK